MKRFRYRLERVLHYRELVKGEKQRILVEHQNRLRAARDHLLALQEAELANQLEQQGLMSAARLKMAADYGSRLRAEIKAQIEFVSMCEIKVQEALNDYIEASKEAKALVQHKDRKLAEYREQADKAEGRFLDELTVQRMHLQAERE